MSDIGTGPIFTMLCRRLGKYQVQESPEVINELQSAVNDLCRGGKGRRFPTGGEGEKLRAKNIKEALLETLATIGIMEEERYPRAWMVDELLRCKRFCEGLYER